MSNSTYLADLANKFDYYFVITLVPFGILTNSLSIIIFLRKSLNTTNMGFFNLLISTSNLITLTFYLFVMESMRIFHYDLAIESDFACKITYLLRRVIREIAPIIEIAMTLERFMSVYYPKRFRFINNRLFLLGLIGFIFVCFVLISFENLFYYLEFNNSTRVFVCTSSQLVSSSSDLVSATLRTFLPFSVMFVLNILMIRRLISRRLIKSATKSRRDYQFTVSVISMNILFLILNFPVSVGYILRIVFSSNLPTSEPSHTNQVIEFFWRVSYLLATANYILTNFTNLLFNRLFRKELIRIFIGEKLEFPSNLTSLTTATRQNALNNSTDRPKIDS